MTSVPHIPKAIYISDSHRFTKFKCLPGTENQKNLIVNRCKKINVQPQKNFLTSMHIGKAEIKKTPNNKYPSKNFSRYPTKI